jgi:hypothetical protein
LRRLEEESESQAAGRSADRKDAETAEEEVSAEGVNLQQDVQASHERLGGVAASIVPSKRRVGATEAVLGKYEIPDSQADDCEFDQDLEPDNLAAATHPQSQPEHLQLNPQRTSADSDPAPPHPPQPLAKPQQPPAHNLSSPQPSPKENPHTLLVLPSLPRLLSPLMHSNHIRGHALLVHLLRSLRHLTSSHAICILILNSVVGGPSSYTDNKKTGGIAGAEGPSIFASNGGLKPALGKTFAWALDLGMMGSELAGAGDGKQGGSVVEVVSDRFGGRVGAWCVLGE